MSADYGRVAAGNSSLWTFYVATRMPVRQRWIDWGWDWQRLKAITEYTPAGAVVVKVVLAAVALAPRCRVCGTRMRRQTHLRT